MRQFFLKFELRNLGCGWSKGKRDLRPYCALRLSRFREHHLTDVDIARQEACLAVSQIILPQPPKPFVESERDENGPGSAKVASPGRQRLGIILPENPFAN